MFSVYINNFKEGNEIITTERLMFSVPSSNGFPVNKPVVKSNEDAADNFSFSMEVNSPYYDSLLPMKTMFRIIYDGDVIFYGRVMDVSKSTVYQTKNVICEGTLAYFKDTYYEGKPEKLRSKMSISDYYTAIINNHNSLVPEKSINKGTITGVEFPSETDKYEPTGWTQSSSLISNLASNYGGHMRIRYSGTTSYLDWYKYYVRDLGDGLRPVVSVGKNILDLSTSSDNANIFTRVIPIGDTDSNNGKPVYVEGYTYTDKNGETHMHSTKYIPVTLINSLYQNSELNDEFHKYSDYANSEDNYGIIYTTMSFSDAKTQEKLWDLAKKWIKECYFGFIESFSVRAIDMHVVNTDIPKILLGECIDVKYRANVDGSIVWVTKKLVCKSVQYDLFNPENSSYTIGIPSDLLEYNKNNKKSSKSKDLSSSGKKTIPKKDEDEEVTWHKVWQMIGTLNGDQAYEGTNAALSFYDNGQLSGTVKCYDPDEIPAGQSVLDNKDKWFDASIVGKITVSGNVPKVVCVSGERGIFAYVGWPGEYPVRRVSHWYTKKKGYKYEGSEPLKAEEASGDIYATDDQTPEGNKTIVMEPTVLTGQGSAGELKVGYDLTSQTDQWRVHLNVPIEYTDADGHIQIADGFVSASDFNVAEIPSFKTKIGIFDIVVAGKVEAMEIAAELAELGKIFGDRIEAETSVRAAELHSDLLRTVDLLSTDITFTRGLYYKYGPQQTDFRDLKTAFRSAWFESNNGKIYLHLYDFAGSEYSPTPNFNIADTQFFKDEINKVYGAGYSASINPGQSTTITLKYDDPQTGQTRDTGRSYTITAGSASVGNVVGVTVPDDYNDHYPGSFYVTGTGIQTKYFEDYLYLTVGAWHDAGTHGFNKDYVACNIRLGGTSGPLVARRWIEYPYTWNGNL